MNKARPADEHARHRDPHLPAARQRANVAVDPFVVETEPVQHFARLTLERVAAEMVVFLLHLAEALEDCGHLSGPGGIGHRVLQRLELVMQVAQTPTARDGLVEHRSARHLLDVLTEIANRQLLRDGHLAFVRRFFADDHAKERGLACAIRADEPDLVARVDLERDVDKEEDLASVLFANIGEGDH
jgi:hypothetical protein